MITESLVTVANGEANTKLITMHSKNTHNENRN